jgi:ribosomal protein S18 acetylase RimI-like enzyme
VIEIRPYRPSDLGRLHAIDQAAFEPALAWSLAELRGFISWRRAHTLVAERTAEPSRSARSAPSGGGAGGAAAPPPPPVTVGFATCLVERAGIGRVTTLDILPEEQRQGLGSRLLAALESWLWGQGARLILLETVVGPRGARAFYERHGYAVLERLPRYYGDGRDAFLMGKKRAPAAQPSGEGPG